MKVLVAGTYAHANSGELHKAARAIRRRSPDGTTVKSHKQVNWSRVLGKANMEDSIESAAVWASQHFDRLVMLETPKTCLSKGVYTFAGAFLRQSKRVYVYRAPKIQRVVIIKRTPNCDDEGAWKDEYARVRLLSDPS